VKARLPAHNRALRRKLEAGIGECGHGLPRFLPAVGIDTRGLPGSLGPFGSRASFRSALRQLASAHRLCEVRLGLERRATGPCFARQLGRCNGACVGEESHEAHDARLAQALDPLRIPPWPFAGAAYVRESSADGERVDVHVFRDWCWLGTAHDESELARIADAPPRAQFDGDVTRLLLRRQRAGTLGLRPLAASMLS
jgi:DNA polymerase-3 subunit epsilon